MLMDILLQLVVVALDDWVGPGGVGGDGSVGHGGLEGMEEMEDMADMEEMEEIAEMEEMEDCLLYTSPSPRDRTRSRMPSSA